MGWEYSITISPSQGRVAQEFLTVGHSTLYDSTPADKSGLNDPVLEIRYYRGNPGRQPHLKFERARPALTQFDDITQVDLSHAAHAAQIAEEFAPLLVMHGDPRRPGGGRREMTLRSIANRNRFFALCPEVAELRDRIGATLN